MAAKKKETFSDKMTKLEQIVEKLEREDLDLEKAVELFEKGVELSKQCNSMLLDAEKKVEILLAQSDGSVQAHDFDPGLDEEDSTQ